MAPSSPRPLWRRAVGSPWFHLVAAFVVVGLLLSFVAKPYWVPSGSMEGTLKPDDRVLVDRLSYIGAEPATGDVVVFEAGPRWDAETGASADPLRSVLRWVGATTGFGPSGGHTLVKRVIGTPGQSVACCTADGAVTVDGVALDEPYVTDDFAFEPGVLDCTTTPRSLRCFDAVVVPEDSLLMLGDHRSHSSDSAAQCRGDAPTPDCWRWASRSDVVGRAVLLLWPIPRWRSL